MFRDPWIPFLSLMFSPSPCPGHYPGVWLLWRLLTSVFSPYELLRMTPYSLTSCRPSLFRISQKGGTLPDCAGIFWNRNPTGNFTGNDFILHGIQISPDKNVNLPCVAAPFTVSPVPWASTCCAALPRDSALYDVSVRQLASLHSGFLQTPPHGDALAIG